MSLRCSYTHNHLAIVAAQGQIAPCCQYADKRSIEGQLFLDDVNTLDGILQSEHWNEIRNELENGKKLNGCRNCWKAEQHSLESKRQYGNNVHPTPQIGRAHV